MAIKDYYSRLPAWLKLFSFFIVFFIGWLLFRQVGKSKITAPQYQTQAAEKGTLVSTVSASGTISSTGTTSIVTTASGTIKNVYVKNGEKVVKGQKIAELILDDEAENRRILAWTSYIDAVNAEKAAKKNKITADISMWENRQAIFDALEDQDYKNNHTINPDTKEDYTDSEKIIIDKKVDEARAAFTAYETAYKNADAQISKAKAQIASAWKSYQQSMGIITAPASGIVNNLILIPNAAIAAASNANSPSNTGVGTIENPEVQYTATVNLTEVDVIKIVPNQKVTLTLDVYPDKTFTGKVLSIDTSGKVSSGVTQYPTTIVFDPTEVKIYPNMAVNTQIIIEIAHDVIIIPSSAIQTSGSQKTVRVMKNGNPEEVVVETGINNDTQTAILSGIDEGDLVVTATINSSGQNSGQSGAGSPFSTFGGNRNFGGGAVRIMR